MQKNYTTKRPGKEENMSNVIQNRTATEQIFDIELRLARISAWIGRARLPLERAYGDEPTRDDADGELHAQIQNIREVIQSLDQLRLELLHGRAERC